VCRLKEAAKEQLFIIIERVVDFPRLKETVEYFMSPELLQKKAIVFSDSKRWDDRVIILFWHC
jgi:hypothetical protein